MLSLASSCACSSLCVVYCHGLGRGCFSGSLTSWILHIAPLNILLRTHAVSCSLSIFLSAVYLSFLRIFIIHSMLYLYYIVALTKAIVKQASSLSFSSPRLETDSRLHVSTYICLISQQKDLDCLFCTQTEANSTTSAEDFSWHHLSYCFLSAVGIALNTGSRDKTWRRTPASEEYWK